MSMRRASMKGPGARRIFGDLRGLAVGLDEGLRRKALRPAGEAPEIQLQVPDEVLAPLHGVQGPHAYVHPEAEVEVKLKGACPDGGEDKGVPEAPPFRVDLEIHAEKSDDGQTQSAEDGSENIEEPPLQLRELDRKSTRLNSSHQLISY